MRDGLGGVGAHESDARPRSDTGDSNPTHGTPPRQVRTPRQRLADTCRECLARRAATTPAPAATTGVEHIAPILDRVMARLRERVEAAGNPEATPGRSNQMNTTDLHRGIYRHHTRNFTRLRGGFLGKLKMLSSNGSARVQYR